MGKSTTLCVAALLFAAVPAVGQDTRPDPGTAGGPSQPSAEVFVLADNAGQLLELRVLADDEVDQLRKWISDAKDYQRWRARWFNYYTRNMFGPTERHHEPLAPAWMAEQCRTLAFYDPRPAGILRDACDLQTLLRTLQQQEPAMLQVRYAQARQEDEAHASFWDRIYIDGVWTSVDSGSGVLGLAGVHTGLWSLGRVSPFTLPGIMLVSVPDNKGGRIIKPAATFGLSIEWFDFNFMSRRTKVHFTIAKAFVAAATPRDRVMTVDLAGFSFTSARER